MNNILLLASHSYSRRQLLAQANIPFVLLDQSADESECDWNAPLTQLVTAIAKHKMEQVILPRPSDKPLFVLTADTLTQDLSGTVLGKPISQAQAAEMVRSVRAGARIATAFCLDKKVYRFDTWQTQERIMMAVESSCLFNVPEHSLEQYLNNVPAMNCSAAMYIEGYGALFLKSVIGSYTTIIGLPICEVRQALEKIGFFNDDAKQSF